jgi:type IV pilus assembly protein PilB
MMLDAINDGCLRHPFRALRKKLPHPLSAPTASCARSPRHRSVIKEKIASRIKVISRLNIAEKRVPQDGRMRLVLSKSRSIDFRVSTLPTMYGEKIVLRILDPAAPAWGSMHSVMIPTRRRLLDAIHRPYGMILVTGPTGSGKTVSLYTCLNILNKPGVNIATAEDPAEIPLPGINQVNVDDKAGLTFPVALKAFLRQDPDIIMVGEIRDLETAEIAIKAAQTGHMVLSTLHTNDAPATLTRLMNMGIPTFNIASSILLITAQRLVRRFAPARNRSTRRSRHCSTPASRKATSMAVGHLYGPGGVIAARAAATRGGRSLSGHAGDRSDSTHDHGQWHGTRHCSPGQKEGVNDLRRSGLLKVKQGLTSLDEVLGSTNA